MSPIPEPWLFRQVDCPYGVNVRELAAELSQLEFVELAYVPGRPVLSTVAAYNDPLSGYQGYLNPAPEGIDAKYAWLADGGTGEEVVFADLEWGWLTSHEDLASIDFTLLAGVNSTVKEYQDHGTAVLGVVAARDNRIGIVGIAPGLKNVALTSTFDAAETDVIAERVLLTLNHLVSLPHRGEGDVMLVVLALEVPSPDEAKAPPPGGTGGRPGGATRLVPLEADRDIFMAIQMATIAGITVVEPAGNDQVNLDTYNHSKVEGNVFFPESFNYRGDSGAIIVGAATSTDPHRRLGSGPPPEVPDNPEEPVGPWITSNYGVRVDCYAWGENVATCGGTGLGVGTTPETQYRRNFNSTSSASAIIAGAAVVLQSIGKRSIGMPFLPEKLRALLSNPLYGTPQDFGISSTSEPSFGGPIGVMPDLRKIIDNALGLAADVYIRDSVGDRGDTPRSPAFASPDIIVMPNIVADPVAAFGDGSGTEDTTSLGGAEAGQDNFVYVRLRNRGPGPVPDATVTVWAVPAATLDVPDHWTRIGERSGVFVAGGDSLTVVPPIVWRARDLPSVGDHRLVASVSSTGDPGPTPADLATFASVYDFYSRSNNLAFGKVHVANAELDRGPLHPLPPLFDRLIPSFTRLSFLFVAPHEKSIATTLELHHRLPHGSQILLEMPPAAAGDLRVPLPWLTLDKARKRALVRIPRMPVVRFSGADFRPGARHQCHLWVRVPGAKPGQGFRIELRQLHRNAEAGRITWVVRQAGAANAKSFRKSASGPDRRQVARRRSRRGAGNGKRRRR